MKLAYEYAEANGLKLREDYTFRDLGVSAYDRTNIEKGALSLFLRAVREGGVKSSVGPYYLLKIWIVSPELQHIKLWRCWVTWLKLV